jgi:transcriptional regulator with XRE-family HTH domain
MQSTRLNSTRVPRRKTSNAADDVFQMERQALAELMARQRLALGLSQETLAYEADVDRSYVSQIERGQGNPSLRVLCQLARRLGLPLRELFSQEACPEPVSLQISESLDTPGVFRKLFDRPSPSGASTPPPSNKK